MPPFYNDNLDKMFEAIKFAELNFPKKIKTSTNAKDLITRLLERKPDLRLGAKHGITEIKNHPFFVGFYFELILQRKVRIYIR